MIARIFISGFVQGVGYRRFVRHHAFKLGLTGWIKNIVDNRVEAVFQGSKENIEKVISICRKGPFLSEVRDIAIKWEDKIEGFESFEIRK